jgi:hypothetical protein
VQEPQLQLRARKEAPVQAREEQVLPQVPEADAAQRSQITLVRGAGNIRRRGPADFPHPLLFFVVVPYPF